MSPRKAAPEPIAALPESERKALSSGIAFALGCAAALSAPTLYELARLIGFAAALAWLLPAALDGYAGTSIWIGRRITRTHPAARAARRNARLALGLTVACNGLYHLLVLGGNSIPRGLHIGLLVAVSSLPPFIVDRLLHLNAIANGTGSPEASAPATTREVIRKAATVSATSLPPPAGNPVPELPPASSTAPRKAAAPEDEKVASLASAADSGKRRAELALPLWRQHVATTGRDPNAAELAALLRAAHPELPMGKTDRTERNIRAATKELVDAEADPERAREAS